MNDQPINASEKFKRNLGDDNKLSADLEKRLKTMVASLAPEDLERAAGYAHDLAQGLNLLRTIPQGVTVFGSARVREGDKFYDKARELGAEMAKNGHAITTGGGPGIMEAANRGAYEYGGRSVGLNITLEHEQFANQYLTDVLEFKYFFARKVMLCMASKVFVYFPGGFGTFDELSEILCLMQENKMPRMPLFLFGKSYWRGLDRFIRGRVVKEKYINLADTHIYKVTDDIQEIVRAANKIGHPRVNENLYDNFDPRKSMPRIRKG
ncbi:TIGR00730 family Rossman fold protein [Candidatus Saccharibacteria bacterium]|nr:TIGR00730 family Rossman fold protein [Candidatus Saccharibacteria bacterium]MBR0415593.1 TIGR00730 family Rossman fold protein [Candidatus Saccharibacteria bacterium]